MADALTTAAPDNAPKAQTCPHCGYCPTCGKARYHPTWFYYPQTWFYYPPTQPYYQPYYQFQYNTAASLPTSQVING